MKILIIILFIIHFIFIKWDFNTKYIEFNKKNQKKSKKASIFFIRYLIIIYIKNIKKLEISIFYINTCQKT